MGLAAGYPTEIRGSGAAFATTLWSVVICAGDTASPGSQEALEKLCRSYWFPIYGYLRRRHHSPADAEDLAQGFFASLLRHESLASVAPEHGRFRSFLLASLRHFLADEYDRAMAMKRGGGVFPISLDADTAEAFYARQVSDGETPEHFYDRQWAWSVLRRAQDRLREECRRAGKLSLYDALGPQMPTPARQGESLTRIAARLGSTENALRVAAFRLRQRYQELVRAEIRETVHDPSEVDAEIRHLIEVLSPGG